MDGFDEKREKGEGGLTRRKLVHIKEQEDGLACMEWTELAY